ncbi:hypothetical protein M422DRAFT_30889 [Sphaerobolus stellatus SS14]|uniref:Uncharacterized protein n=1 Tax=Sphaerobolus stellatus (strain SS14) TaxID=990650 RepID=A0A0C9UK92_SPHS4|nr:hypothetical protein M422DRAFT_30889 [Sphaerobolus stellatus SS14]
MALLAGISLYSKDELSSGSYAWRKYKGIMVVPEDLYTDNRYLHVIQVTYHASQRLQCLAGGAPLPSRYIKTS